MTRLAYPHIDDTRKGVAYISGTQTKVIEIALDRIAHHWDADEIQRQHPHSSLGQIYAALAYYFDHQKELDEQIDEQIHFVEQSKAKAGESPIRTKLEALGRL